MLYDILFRYTSQPFHFRLIMFLTFAISVIVALTIHEFAHAFIAHKLGDDTAKLQGRMSLNPKVHFDLIGIVCFLFLGFGWAKPVPINTYNFKNIKRDTFLVSIAGIVANVILAVVFCPFAILMETVEISTISWTFYTLFNYMFIANASFAAFNILPISPLDGYNALASQLSYSNPYVKFMQKYGTLVLIIVVIVLSYFGLPNFIGYPLEKLWRLILGL